ncbi:MAG: oligosaccharide flippase family protein, partial [Candidatus Cloacimonadota bacterium]|nr:oligosaccharide flippase family protein [Candidatus Cloacimonadota bacterium]
MVNKGLLRKFLDYSVATIINKGLFFLILPILTYYLLPEEYAIYSLLMFFASLVSMFFQFGLQQSLMTLYHSQKTDASRYKLISTTYLSIFLITFLGSICLLGWHQTILKLILNITITSLHKKLYIFTIFYIIFNLFTAVTLILLNIRHDSKQFSYLSLSKNSLLFIFIVVGAI